MRIILWLSLLPFCLMNFSINIFLVTGHCLGHQQSLLLQLKNNLIFKPTKSKKLVHWNQSDDCCEWNGVTCNKGRVIALDLSHEFISGHVGNLTSLFNLKYLQSLNLAYNEFHSEIHSEFQKLNNLRYLNLSNSGFEGQIPIEISYLNKLATLDLSSTFTSPHALKLEKPNIAMLVQNFTEIKELYLDGIAISTKGKEWSHALSSLQNLQVLSMSSCNLSGPLDSSLASLQSLSILRLNQNNLASPVPEYFGSFSNFTTLQLSGCRLNGVFPKNIFQIPSMQVLDVSDNLDLHGSLPNFPLQGSFNTLNLSHTNFSGPLPESIHNLRQLSTLDLSNCKFNGTLPNSVSDLTQLVHLDLSFNNFTGPLPSFNRSKALTVLSLNHNDFKDFEGPFQSLSSNLFKLDLHSNQLQGPAPTFLKNAIYLDYSSNGFNSINSEDIGSHFPFLYFLSLSNNSFHGRIHESFCNISGLRALDLSHNSFNGPIPMCLTRRSSTLRLLNLGGNQLNGHISDTFSTSCDLRFLDLSGNLLRGTIPKSLANCKHMQVLNLGNNQLIDKFPCFLKNISSLRVMILRSNKLHGHVGCPNNTGNWETLQIVDLASNNFSGTLPATLLQSWPTLMLDEDKGGRFGHLFFDLYDNFNPENFKTAIVDLSGELQMKLAKIIAAEPPFLIDHIISHIFEEGVGLRTYEDSVTIVNKGRQLNLVKILIAFTSLDFSSNHFEGPIPEELMNLTALHALNLSQNAFSGSIPSSLGNLKHLESLDLSINSLSGEIPTELARLSFISVMNLSYNHLVGKIPTGTQIQTFEADSFIGNEGLCGPPLTPNCSGEGGQGLSPPASESPYSHNGSSIDWNFLSAELGFTFGFGIFILPVIFWKRWRMWYSKHVDDLLYRIIPQLDFVYEHHGGKKYRTIRWKPY
ncbi:Leucine-rich repeat [Sesbania bispinosa]|nr:Leucine-rich repeat [Sesbania bispinosa]